MVEWMMGRWRRSFFNCAPISWTCPYRSNNWSSTSIFEVDVSWRCSLPFSLFTFSSSSHSLPLDPTFVQHNGVWLVVVPNAVGNKSIKHMLLLLYLVYGFLFNNESFLFFFFSIFFIYSFCRLRKQDFSVYFYVQICFFVHCNLHSPLKVRPVECVCVCRSIDRCDGAIPIQWIFFCLLITIPESVFH